MQRFVNEQATADDAYTSETLAKVPAIPKDTTVDAARQTMCSVGEEETAWDL